MNPDARAGNRISGSRSFSSSESHIRTRSSNPPETAVNESIDDLTVDYEDNGQLIIRELDKAVLSKGAWTTILFRYQQWQPETGDYGPDKYVIQRYKKSGGEYRRQSKFNISSAEQARKIVDTLTAWIGDSGNA